MSDNRIPPWISEHVPRELVESTLFRFDVKLQVIEKFCCKECGIEQQNGGKCNECGEPLKAKNKRALVDIVKDLDLDYDLLEEQMQELPSQYAFWSAVYSEARMQVALDERRFKATKGRVTEKAQQTARAEGLKFTNEQIKSVIEADPEVAKSDLRLQSSQMRCGKLFHMMEALKMKSELARSLAGFKRQEREQA